MLGHHIQRVFTHQHKKIEEPYHILRYLLEKGSVQQYDDRVIDDFIIKAGQQPPRRSGIRSRKTVPGEFDLTTWLKKSGIKTPVSQLLRAAYDSSRYPTTIDLPGKASPVEEMSMSEDSAEDEDYDPAMELEKESPGTKAGDSDSQPTEEGPEGFTPEEVHAIDIEANELDRRNAELPEGKPVLIITWNLEKYGRKTDREKKRLKRRALLEILDTYHPSLLVMQEVTDAGLLFTGEKLKAEEPIPLGAGLETANLFQLVNENEVDEVNRDVEDLETPNPLGLDQTGLIRHYPLGSEFGLKEGPKYTAGKTYREYYPLIYERVQALAEPKPFFIRSTETEGEFQLDKIDSGHVEAFSSEDAITRELLVWKMTLQTGGYSFRESTRDQGAGEKIEKQDLYVCVVHTSPSNKKGIRTEVEEIMQKADWLRQRTGCPVILAGDWYMEKENEKLFGDLAGGKKSGWQLGASPMEEGDVALHENRPVWRLSEVEDDTVQFHQTNFPHHGVGQTADHFVISEDLRVEHTRAIPYKEKMQSWPEDREPMIEEEDLATWTEVGADHVPVLTVVYASVMDLPTPSEPSNPTKKKHEQRSFGPPEIDMPGPTRPLDQAPLSKLIASVSQRPIPTGSRPTGGSGSSRRHRGELFSKETRAKAIEHAWAHTGQENLAYYEISGKNLDCLIRSVIRGLALQLGLQLGYSVDGIVELIRQRLVSDNLAGRGALDAGGPEAQAIRALIRENSQRWFGVANVNVQVNIMQWQYNVNAAQMDMNHHQLFPDGTHTVWLYRTAEGIGHFDLVG